MEKWSGAGTSEPGPPGFAGLSPYSYGSGLIMGPTHGGAPSTAAPGPTASGSDPVPATDLILTPHATVESIGR